MFDEEHYQKQLNEEHKKRMVEELEFLNKQSEESMFNIKNQIDDEILEDKNPDITSVNSDISDFTGVVAFMIFFIWCIIELFDLFAR